MRVAILMGRGIEGCGVSKFTIEMAKYLQKHGHEYVVIAAKDKTWSRKNSHEMPNLMYIKFADDGSVDHVADACNSCNLVVINSLPPYAYKKNLNYDVKVAENFRKILQKISAPTVLFQHDHNKISITRNDCLKESIEKSKALFAHSPTGDFAGVVENMSEAGGVMGFFGGDAPKKEILNFQPGMYFDEVRQKYWKPIEQTDKMCHRWIGRMALWKGPRLMFDFHEKHLRKMNALTILEGMEKSLAFVEIKQKYSFQYFNTENPGKVDFTDWYGNTATVFSFYKNHELLERLSKSGYGYQLSLLDSRFIKRSIEYTHCEVAAAGAIPVFHRGYGEACTHRVLGKPLTECVDSGTIWLSNDNMEQCADLISALNTDDGLRNEYREKAYEFYKSHQDADAVFDEAFKLIGEAK
jgi:hypothetical protein